MNRQPDNFSNEPSPGGSTYGPPPRKVQASPGFRLKLGCLRLFILPHALVGIGMLLLLCSKISLGLLGTQTEARIVEKVTHRSSKGSKTYKVKYTFTCEGSVHEGYSRISRDTFRALPEQGAIPIVYLSLSPEYLSEYKDPGRTFPESTWSSFFFAAFWNALVGIPVYILYIAPWRRKQLLIFGAETGGTISATRIASGRRGKSQYTIDYTYEMNGQSFCGSVKTLQELHDRCKTGDPVTVVYDPKNPKRSTSPELGEWQVINSPSTH